MAETIGLSLARSLGQGKSMRAVYSSIRRSWLLSLDLDSGGAPYSRSIRAGDSRAVARSSYVGSASGGGSICEYRSCEQSGSPEVAKPGVLNAPRRDELLA
jgi:hypothetical protein